MPKTWKDIILKDKGDAKNLVIFDHHIVRNSPGVEVFATTVDDSYSLTVDVGASIWGVVGVPIPWEGRLVLPFFIIIIIIIVIIIIIIIIIIICVCVFVFSNGSLNNRFI